MNRKGKAETVWAKGRKWVWDYAARRWTCSSKVGRWQLWFQDGEWLLQSPCGSIYTAPRQYRYDAMVQAVLLIEEVERRLA